MFGGSPAAHRDAGRDRIVRTCIPNVLIIIYQVSEGVSESVGW